MSPKRGGEPKRKVSDTAKRLSIIVFTEGKKTEPIYFTHWSRAYREKVIVTIDDFHGAPLSLVQEAAARRAADIKAARRGGGDAYTEYWCVFDIDEHPNVARALELAASSSVSVCVTNPLRRTLVPAALSGSKRGHRPSRRSAESIGVSESRQDADECRARRPHQPL